MYVIHIFVYTLLLYSFLYSETLEDGLSCDFFI